MKAWEWLEQHEWVQGWFFLDPNNKTQGACCLGAIWEACDGKIDSYEKNRDRIALAIPGGSVSQWNDEPGRTKEEVVALLKELDI